MKIPQPNLLLSRDDFIVSVRLISAWSVTSAEAKLHARKYLTDFKDHRDAGALFFQGVG